MGGDKGITRGRIWTTTNNRVHGRRVVRGGAGNKAEGCVHVTFGNWKGKEKTLPAEPQERKNISPLARRLKEGDWGIFGEI